ncbi:neutral ceramidase [Neodiprion fabricii]|uniref:neutral ceramidase n=1 Tax=Neodiprion fabricii TaxID=2872261 RepID=UPI001ED94FD7|nr:neutral ceramidase [Neodiprion fabricii]XP_046412295.1 neutral ceramidase [Neodiprion fabricii]XP_046412304.1 neutral ceramidase [Neodiprion fabricii]XP_046412311.1 neutral ceramidase [Neodiprion fabricii]XP_046412320.1 neutral ceramidase [Neodiprion fabricii]XP_046412330.1 neutral ceramidase [Neodiprion fabricii]XP_046412337.1 neutral ceramidase [Neodiprion fabricii]
MDSMLKFHRLLKLCFLLTALCAAEASYNVGVGIADTTGPVAEIVFMGYARPEQKGSGLHLRTFSRAFIIDDGEERFVFVSVDSAMIGHGVRLAVLKKLSGRFDDMYSDKNVMISGTHTHSAPGGYMMDVLFDLTTFGFVQESFNAIVNGITKSIERAHDALVPGRIFVTQGELMGANINRSPKAYLNNPETERAKYAYNVDKTMIQLQFIAADDRSLGVINWFPVHPTSMNNTNKLVSSDNVGYASILFEKTMNKNSMVGKGSFVAAFASTNLGDVSPNTRGPRCEFTGETCSGADTCPGKHEMCFASGPGRDMFESTSMIANKMYQKALELWHGGKAKEVTGPIRVIHQYIRMPEQEAEFFNETTGNVENVTGCLPAMGYSFAAGTTDGPGSFSFEQGTTTSNPLWNAIRDFLAAPSKEDVLCHGAKPILLATGRMVFPYEWQPQVVSTHVALLGDVIIAGVPGEFTTMSGRRLRNAIKGAMQNSASDDGVVVIAGLCNTYSDYVTTPEEYQIQRYEGASTIYGPHTLTIYLKQYKELVTALLARKSLVPGPQPPDLYSSHLISLVTPVLFDTPKWRHEFGDCLEHPAKVAGAGDTVTARFVAGHPRNNPMAGGSFLFIERLEDDESWKTVATDANWETKFIWKRTSIFLGSSEVTISWTIPDDVEPGEYRIRHNGNYRYILGGIYPYKGVSNHFEVVAFGSSRRKRYYFA